MLGCGDHKGHTVKRIAPCRIDFEFVSKSSSVLIRDLKIHKRSFRSADPGNFLLLHRFGIIYMLQSLEQLIRVFSDAQEPDVLRKLNDITVADIALASLRVLVGKDNLAVRAVIDQRFRAENKPVLKQFQENPLCPFIIIGARGREFAAPVEREADLAQLFRKMRNVLLRNDVRVRVRLDRVVFRRQAERIKADRKQHVVSLHPSLSRENLNARICLDMAYVHARAGRIRKLDEPVPFRSFIKIDCLESLCVSPGLLPFRLDFPEIISHFLSSVHNKRVCSS